MVLLVRSLSRSLVPVFHSRLSSTGRAMNWSASVLTSISSDTEPTIILTFDNAKYIFNAGENANRAFLQSRYNWKRTKAIFLTQTGTQRAGGLAGLLMTFADGGTSSLDIVGPTGLLHRLASMRMYTYRSTVHVRPIEAHPGLSSSTGHIYKDENITVYGIPISPCLAPECGEPPSPSGDRPLKRRRSPSPQHPLKRVSVEPSNALPSNRTGSFPTSLSGSPAQEWRTSMVKIMFPADRKHENELSKEKKKEEKKGKEKAGTDENDNWKRPPVPDGYHRQLPSFFYSGTGTPDSPPVLAYLVVGPRIRGRFDAKKAGELGIPNGPIRKRLVNGETVTFTAQIKQMLDGVLREVRVERSVKPEECVGESETPAAILILDIPSPAYIPSLLSSFNNPFFAKFRSNNPESKREHVVRTVFHMVGDGVLEDERYVQFVKSFEGDDDCVHHLVASREYCPDPVTFTSAAFNLLRLNQLDESMFPVLKFSLHPRRDISSILNLPSSVRPMESNHTISMRPFKAPLIEAPVGDNFHPAVKDKKPASLPPWTAKRFEAAKKSMGMALKRSESESDGSSAARVSRGRDVAVLPLGTGSAVPSKHRNVSGTLISIPGWGNVLLDAGEGTWGQLVRQFGLGDGVKAQETTEENSGDVWQVLRDLKCIFISHIHADHHMGLATLLAKRRQLDPPPKEPLYLVSIRAVHLYLRELSNLQNLGIVDCDGEGASLSPGVVSIMSEALHWKQFDTYQTSGMWQIGGSEPWLEMRRSRQQAQLMCCSLGLENFQTVDMYHRTRCYGAVMKHQDGWSIVFSGDTLPVDTLIRAGRNPTLLIHEATMADDQEELANSKAHSTFNQAITVGKKMHAKHILLTHFSARYPKMPPSAVGKAEPDNEPVFLDSSDVGDISKRSRTPSRAARQRLDPDVAVAFDHLNLTIGDMWKVNHYLPAIEQSFQDTIEDDDEVDETSVMEVDHT